MAKTKECPQCGADISHTYESYDPSVGIMSGGWFCVVCDIPIDEDDDTYEEEHRMDLRRGD